ncbi:hypothetical protein BGZ94_006503 [Podila epigama]|nr:hypothetical protein BGZ94_006503 [Podila epigama]
MDVVSQHLLRPTASIQHAFDTLASLGNSIKGSGQGFGQGLGQGDTFLGLPMTPTNILCLKTVAVGFFIQPTLFYLTWYLKPSLSQNRRGLAWVLSLYCSLTLLTLFIFEVGYMRTSIFENFGIDTETLGLNPEATVFSYFTPSLYAWVQRQSVGQGQETSVTTMIGTFWQMVERVMAMPLFSLAPNKLSPFAQPGVMHPFFGGGRRLAFSLENYPRETSVAALAVGYFVSYCLVDLVLGVLHYSQYVDPLSGYFHHVMYTYLSYRIALAKSLSLFHVCGSPIEFYYADLPASDKSIYGFALLLHCFWLTKYVRYLRRKAAKAKQQKQKQQQEQEAEKLNTARTGAFINNASTSSTTGGRTTIQLRVKKSKGRSTGKQ